MEILELILLIGRLALTIYFLWKFVSGDKSKRETLWYGLPTLIFMV